jgi:hypothetical protein
MKDCKTGHIYHKDRHIWFRKNALKITVFSLITKENNKEDKNAAFVRNSNVRVLSTRIFTFQKSYGSHDMAPSSMYILTP